MTNAQNMTLEERIVQTLKNDTLMKLVGAALARKADSIWDKLRDQSSLDAVSKMKSAMGML